jgi:hypothetical protein
MMLFMLGLIAVIFAASALAVIANVNPGFALALPLIYGLIGTYLAPGFADRSQFMFGTPRDFCCFVGASTIMFGIGLALLTGHLWVIPPGSYY